MTTTERLLNVSKEIWEAYHEHPFVKGIADGSLDKEKFKYYMIQDYLYLLDYTKVFAIGVAKSDIKNVDINLYPIMSPFIISLLNTSSAIAKNPIKQINNIIHFNFFTINSFTFSFIFFLHLFDSIN